MIAVVVHGHSIGLSRSHLIMVMVNYGLDQSPWSQSWSLSWSRSWSCSCWDALGIHVLVLLGVGVVGVVRAGRRFGSMLSVGVVAR